jgi:tetratricopeptide (TPR) repeat protein
MVMKQDKSLNTTTHSSRPFPLLTAIHLAILTVSIFMVYWQSLSFDFTWDDKGLIVSNPVLSGKLSAGQFLAHDFWGLTPDSKPLASQYYRPIVTMSFAMDHALWGLSPMGFHLTNILLHMACTILVYSLGAIWLKSRPASFMASLMFAMHPSHVENIAWISGRTDLLCALFYLSALLIFIKMAERDTSPSPSGLFGLGVLTMAALLSKEMALSLPIVAYGYLTLTPDRTGGLSKNKKPLLTLLGALAAYSVLRMIMVIEFSRGDTSLISILISIPVIFMRYLSILFLVKKVAPYHHEAWLDSIGSGSLAMAILVCAVYIILILVNNNRKRTSETFFLSWIPISLLPVLLLGLFSPVLYADRCLYIPSVGFCLLWPALLLRYSQNTEAGHRKLMGAYALLFAVSILMAGSSHIYARHWQNNTTLFYHAARMEPASAMMQYNLGQSLHEQGQLDQAVLAYKRAIELDPGYTEAHANLGQAWNQLHDFQQAIEAFEKAMDTGPPSPITLSNAAHAYRMTGKLERTLALYREALSIRPSDILHNNIGECLLVMKKYDQAREQFKAAVHLKPSSAAFNNLALLEMEQQHYREAKVYMQEALLLKEDNISHAVKMKLYFNMTRALYHLGELEQAANYAEYVITAMAKGEAPPDNDPEVLGWLLKEKL